MSKFLIFSFIYKFIYFNFKFSIFLFNNLRGKLSENDSLFRISKEQFENLLDRIKSGS